MAGGVGGAESDVASGERLLDAGDQRLGLRARAVMDGERRRAAAGDGIGEGGARAAGAGKVEAPALDRVTLVPEPADEAAAVQQGADEAAVFLAADGVDDAGVDAVALDRVAQQL